MPCHGSSSFSSFKAYTHSLLHTPERFLHRACSVSTTFQETTQAKPRSGSEMAKTLRWFDLIGFGLGGMIGAGVFVTTGKAAKCYAGPGIILSYALSGVCALLSAFCYTEFAVEMPVAGGAFSYLRITFGEFSAFITGANLIMEYVFSNAAVARSFTGYLGSALGVSAIEKWKITVSGLPEGFNSIDLIAVGIVLILTLCVCYSTKESSVLNMVLTSVHVLSILFVIIVGFWRGDSRNFTHPENPTNPSGFLPYGVTGVFSGAALIYMSYIGYDAVSTMAEEVKDPIRDIPIGISGSVLLVTILYCLMAASMSKLVPYDSIDIESPFSSAFRSSDGWGWVSNVIGVVASFGILTSLLVAMLGQARYLCVIGRSNVVPSWFANINPRTCTPINASAFLGICTAVISMFTELSVLLNLISIGTLFVFYMVANAVIYRRYVVIGSTNPWPTTLFLLSFTSFSVIFTLFFQFSPPGNTRLYVLGSCTAMAVALIQLFQFMVPQARKPEFWKVPLMPWIPAISIFLNVFLLGSLDRASYLRFVVFSAIVVLVYLLYSVHASHDAEIEELKSLNQKLSETHFDSEGVRGSIDVNLV